MQNSPGYTGSVHYPQSHQSQLWKIILTSLCDRKAIVFAMFYCTLKEKAYFHTECGSVQLSMGNCPDRFLPVPGLVQTPQLATATGITLDLLTIVLFCTVFTVLCSTLQFTTVHRSYVQYIKIQYSP